jgi:predicted nucleic acid-binding protein
VAEADRANLVVCDAGPLIHLDELGCLNLLRDFADVQVPEAVWQEVQRHRPSALRRRSVKLNRVSSTQEPTSELIELTQAFLLDAGELEALKLMQENPNAILLTDDAAARLVAQRLEYEVHGTIGVVLRALRRQQRTRRQVLNLLRALPRRSTLFIDRRLLNAITEEVRNARDE